MWSMDACFGSGFTSPLPRLFPLPQDPPSPRPGPHVTSATVCEVHRGNEASTAAHYRNAGSLRITLIVTKYYYINLLCLSVCLCVSVWLSVCLPLSVSVTLSVSVSVCLSRSVSVSVCLSVCLSRSVCQSVCLSVCLCPVSYTHLRAHETG